MKGFGADPFDPRILDDREYDAFLDAARRFDDQVRSDAGDRPFIQMEAAWVLVLERGLRSGELLGLRIKDVRLDTHQINIRQQVQRRRGGGSTKGRPRLDGANLEIVALKTKSSKRTLRLTRRSADALRRHLVHLEHLSSLLSRPGAPWNPLGLMFPTIRGNPMQGSALMHSHFRPVCELAGIQYRDAAHPSGFRIHDARHTCATRHLRKHKNLVLTQTLLGHASLAMAQQYVRLVPLNEEAEDDA